MLMHGNGTTVAALEHAQGNVVGLHVAVLDGKPGAQVLVADQREDLPQAGGAMLGGDRILHLVEAHVAHVGVDRIGIVDPLVEAGEVAQAVEQGAAGLREVAEVLVETFDQADELVAAFLRRVQGRGLRLVGLVEAIDRA